MEKFRPFDSRDELIGEYLIHSSSDRKEKDWIIVLRNKFNSFTRVFRFEGNSEFPCDTEDGYVLDWDTLYENYTFLDGSPCGMIEESETVNENTDSKGDCLEEASLYEQIQALSIEPSVKEHLLEQVRSLNKLNSQLEDDLHDCRVEIKKMKEIIFKLTYELYGE